MKISTKNLVLIVGMFYLCLGVLVCYGLATDVPNTAGYVKSTSN